ncbi:MAG: helix-turn-helix transcriptional regulator [Bifidobacterium crudilactis]|jgi:transcriptional regulator with XRE-family HTH domain|uniref:Helix-turn-helix transcriptional regulator n=1 Tax=Bifidobacterium crudilactis TaxID=327277 RepID=A0A971CZ37_9BIFI|nr:helix-turn-helix transcriptional regulator [Bifidobacterium crudilactis]NLT79749.1 helix-turn-helix transcriptional regulator [Bifidobacterium crudilactis]
MTEGELQRTLGRNLRAYRQAKGMSQEHFADFVEVYRTYMGCIEHGKRNLTLVSVERICEQLGLNPIEMPAEHYKAE